MDGRHFALTAWNSTEHLTSQPSWVPAVLVPEHADGQLGTAWPESTVTSENNSRLAPGFLMLEWRETARNGKQTRNLYNLLKIRNNSIIFK